MNKAKKPGLLSLFVTAFIGLAVFAAVVAAAKLLPLDQGFETVGSGNVPERPAPKPAEHSRPAGADRPQ